jgi:hypothetical protein
MFYYYYRRQYICVTAVLFHHHHLRELQSVGAICGFLLNVCERTCRSRPRF